MNQNLNPSRKNHLLLFMQNNKVYMGGGGAETIA